MEVLENKELAPQEDALSLYLSSLLDEGRQMSIAEHDESPSQKSQPGELFDLLLKESNNSDDIINRPRWATDYFSCLPITVGSETLLVPLRQVRTVVPMKQDIQPINDMPDWITGSMISFSRDLTVIDMQKIVFPDADYPEKIETPSQLVLINDGAIGISCHGVDKVQQLSVKEVTWRAKNAKRRWVSGFSMKHREIIIDPRRIEYALSMESRLV